MPEEFIVPETGPVISWSDKFVGILSSPGELYASVQKNPEKNNSNWGIPMILSIIIAILFTFVVFSQPPIQDQLHETQLKAMQKSVADGKMTQEQMDMAVEKNPAKPGTPMFMIFGAVGASLVTVVMVFAYSGVYWLGGKLALKTNAAYLKVAEVYGLSLFVAVVGTLLTMILMVAMGSLYATPSLALAVNNFDPMDKTHKLLASINVIDFWQLFVIGVGLSKLWSTSTGKAMAVVGGTWVIWTAIKVFVGFGM